jgi:hypothetical protein
MTRTSRLAPLIVLAAALAGSCTEVSTSPTRAVAIQFDTLPFPAVVAGDTLRDSLGRAAPLRALAFNSRQEVIAGAAIAYVALDTGVTISPDGFITAQRRDGTARIVASVGGLQSKDLTLQVARRPDSVVVTGKVSDTLRYALPDNATQNVSAALGVRIVTNDSAGGIGGTKGWLVSFQAFFRGVPLAPRDTTVASLWGDDRKYSALDTTDGAFSASRTLRVRPQAPTFTAAESLIVMATVRYRGVAVRGSPVRFVIHTRPK